MQRARYISYPLTGTPGRVLPIAGLAALVVVWGLVAGLELVNNAFLPTPWDTAKKLVELLTSSAGLTDAWTSIRRVALAILMSSLIGIPLGIAMGAFGTVESLLKWIVFPFRTAPITAFIPLFFMFFGVEEGMKVWFLFFGTVVYIVPMTFDAIRAVPREYIDAAVDFGFSPFGTLRHYVVPAAWPRIFDAIKVCTGIAWTYLVAAEIANVTTGLGRVVYQAQRFQDAPKVYAGILLILFIGNFTDWVLGLIKDRFFDWEA